MECKILKKYFNFLLGLILMALAFNLFIKEVNIILGMSGISLMFKAKLGYDAATVLLVGNILFIILSFIFLGFKSTRNSIVGSLLFPLFVKLTESIRVDFGTTESLLIAIVGSALLGLGLGLVFKAGYTTGGIDIMNQIVAKYFKIPIGKALIICDAIIISSGYFLFGFETFVYTIVSLYITGMITDKIMLGISNSKTFFIFTDKEKEIKELIIKEFKTGVTLLDAQGGYTNKKKKVLLCVMQTKSYIRLKEEIFKIDKDVDFLITDSYEVAGGLKKYEEVV